MWRLCAVSTVCLDYISYPPGCIRAYWYMEFISISAHTCRTESRRKGCPDKNPSSYTVKTNKTDWAIYIHCFSADPYYSFAWLVFLLQCVRSVCVRVCLFVRPIRPYGLHADNAMHLINAPNHQAHLLVLLSPPMERSEQWRRLRDWSFCVSVVLCFCDTLFTRSRNIEQTFSKCIHNTRARRVL